jgi:hypothetical protein
MTKLTEVEWQHVRYGMEVAGRLAGFNYELNPTPWVREYHDVLRKIVSEHPIYGGYLYVADGTVYSSDYRDITVEGLTVIRNDYRSSVYRTHLSAYRILS